MVRLSLQCEIQRSGYPQYRLAAKAIRVRASASSGDARPISIPPSKEKPEAPELLSPLARDRRLHLDGHLLQDILTGPDHRRLRLLGDLLSLLLGALDDELVVDGVYEPGVEAFELLADVHQS